MYIKGLWIEVWKGYTRRIKRTKVEHLDLLTQMFEREDERIKYSLCLNWPPCDLDELL